MLPFFFSTNNKKPHTRIYPCKYTNNKKLTGLSLNPCKKYIFTTTEKSLAEMN